jgi:hypothetical protein
VSVPGKQREEQQERMLAEAQLAAKGKGKVVE